MQSSSEVITRRMLGQILRPPPSAAEEDLRQSDARTPNANGDVPSKNSAAVSIIPVSDILAHGEPGDHVFASSELACLASRSAAARHLVSGSTRRGVEVSLAALAGHITQWPTTKLAPPPAKSTVTSAAKAAASTPLRDLRACTSVAQVLQCLPRVRAETPLSDIVAAHAAVHSSMVRAQPADVWMFGTQVGIVAARGSKADDPLPPVAGTRAQVETLVKCGAPIGSFCVRESPTVSSKSWRTLGSRGTLMAITNGTAMNKLGVACCCAALTLLCPQLRVQDILSSVKTMTRSQRNTLADYLGVFYACFAKDQASVQSGKRVQRAVHQRRRASSTKSAHPGDGTAHTKAHSVHNDTVVASGKRVEKSDAQGVVSNISHAPTSAAPLDSTLTDPVESQRGFVIQADLDNDVHERLAQALSSELADLKLCGDEGDKSRIYNMYTFAARVPMPPWIVRRAVDQSALFTDASNEKRLRAAAYIYAAYTDKKMRHVLGLLKNTAELRYGFMNDKQVITVAQYISKKTGNVIKNRKAEVQYVSLDEALMNDLSRANVVLQRIFEDGEEYTSEDNAVVQALHQADAGFRPSVDLVTALGHGTSDNILGMVVAEGFISRVIKCSPRDNWYDNSRLALSNMHRDSVHARLGKLSGDDMQIMTARFVERDIVRADEQPLETTLGIFTIETWMDNITADQYTAERLKFVLEDKNGKDYSSVLVHRLTSRIRATELFMNRIYGRQNGDHEDGDNDSGESKEEEDAASDSGASHGSNAASGSGGDDERSISDDRSDSGTDRGDDAFDIGYESDSVYSVGSDDDDSDDGPCAAAKTLFTEGPAYTPPQNDARGMAVTAKRDDIELLVRSLYGVDDDDAKHDSEFMYEPLAKKPVQRLDDVGFAAQHTKASSAGLQLQFLEDDAQYDTD